MNTRHHVVRLLPLFASAFVCGLLVSLLMLAQPKPQPLHAENQRIVTIYHDGQQQTVVTDATTVGDVLARAHITTNQYDAVEPGRDTQMVAQNYNINIYRARPVTVIDGTQRYHIMSPYESAKEIAAGAGLTLYPEDTYTLDRIDDFLSEDGIGLRLTITRSVPINVVLYGQTVPMRTQAKTISGLLSEKKIVLGASDGVSPATDQPVSAGMTVDIYRNGTQTVNEERPVDFTIKQVQDADQPIGYKQVQTPGVPGKEVVTFELQLKNGQEISRKEIQHVITVQPKEQVEVVGVKSNGFSGSLGDAFALLRQCEAGGNYADKNNPVYRGAYQFDFSTWGGYGGFTDPADAPPSVQDQKALETYQRRGWAPWPACSRHLGLM